MSGGNFDGVELPEIEVIDEEGVSPEGEVDLKGQIEALKSEKEALESQYNEINKPRIDALSRRIMELEEKQRSAE